MPDDRGIVHRRTSLVAYGEKLVTQPRQRPDRQCSATTVRDASLGLAAARTPVPTSIEKPRRRRPNTRHSIPSSKFWACEMRPVISEQCVFGTRAHQPWVEATALSDGR